jgi:methyl-accepting chemotaxis protein
LKEIGSQLNVLDGKASEIAEAIKELDTRVNAHSDEVNNQFNEIAKRDEEFGHVLEHLSKRILITQIMTIIHFALVLLVLLSLLFPSVRAIFIK